MMEREKRAVSCAEEDRISNLPEHLIDSILERVPIEDAVSTSILSKNWRYKWTKMRALVFDEQFSKKFAKNGAFGHNGVLRIINRVLILHKGSIVKFHLHVPHMNLDSFQEVDQFILLLSRNSVTELILTNLNRRYKLPSDLFSCLELTKLKLKNCFYKPPLEFKEFPNLEDLYLQDIDFGATKCGTEIYLPRLKVLYMHSCTNAHNLNIKATMLRNLTSVACPDAMLLQLLNSPCLVRAVIYPQKPIQDFVQVETMDLNRMFSNMPRIRTFSIDIHFLKFLISEKIPKLLVHAINSLKTLWLLHLQFGDLDQLYGALFLLRSSPNLEMFRMYMKAAPVDVEPASDHLQSPNCLDCTLEKLQTVEMIRLEGSRAEMLFIKLLLAHCPSLKMFTISPSVNCDAKTILSIAKAVMQFPRASTKAEIFYLDPKP